MQADTRIPLRSAALLRLAWHELWHERWMAISAACVLAACLAPLWTLWGLERGVIGTLIERMERDPQMRRITPLATGQHRFDAAWFDRVRTWPEVEFAIPTVRYAASLVDLFSDAASEPLNTELHESAAGDPLLAGVRPPVERAMVLSHSAAQRLQVKPGDALSLALGRERLGQTERVRLDLSVADVLPVQAGSREMAMVSGGLLSDIEHWRDGYTVPGLGEQGQGLAPPRGTHARFRLHTRSIREVEAVAARLAAEGIPVEVDSPQIAATLGLQRNLRAILTLVGVVLVAGAAVALTALQVSTMQRKRREQALLNLTGHGAAWLVALPAVSAVAVALAGAALASLLYGAAAMAIDLHFAAHLASGEAAVRLGPDGLAAGFAGAVLLSLPPALYGGWKASTVETADELREH